MKHILILNLTRMGDIIQSTALFKKIKLTYPVSHVTLLVSTEFSEITPFLQDIDEVKYIDLKGLFEILKSSNFEFNSAVYNAVSNMLVGIKDLTYDIAINLSHDEFSVYFLYILNSKKNIGISITREGSIVSNDKMIAYIFSAVKNRKASVLNLVDIYERCIDGIDKKKQHNIRVNEIMLDIKNSTAKKEALRDFRNNLKDYGIEKEDITVSFAIGASMPSKKWHMDYFAELALMLLNHNDKIKIVLLGAPYDADNGLYIENKVASQRLINLTGKTSVAGLIHMTAASRLLITHDTGTMHIGVSLGVKLIVIYTGHVGFMETGPYAENKVLITPDINCFPCDFNVKCLNQECKDLIKPEYIFDIAKTELDRESSTCSEYLSKYQNSGIIPYISRLDSNGFIDFLPAVKRKLMSNDLRLRILKLSLEYFYEGNISMINDLEINVFLDSFNKTEYNLTADINEEFDAVDALHALCVKGISAAKCLVGIALDNPFDMEKINKSIDNMESADLVLKSISSPYDELSLINQIHIVNRNSSVSYDVFGLGIDALKNYSDYKRLLGIFKRVGAAFLEGLQKRSFEHES